MQIAFLLTLQHLSFATSMAARIVFMMVRRFGDGLPHSWKEVGGERAEGSTLRRREREEPE